MFASLKNKIREETGNEVTVKVNPKKGTLRGRHSRRGSTSSLNSIISTDGLREDQNTSPSSIRDDEDRQSFNMKKDPEYEKKIRDREKFLLMQFEEKDKHNVLLEREKEELETRVNELEEKLKIVEEQKNKLSHYRDDKEQLENLQAQEITKVKHLLLLRERELAERTSSLKESTEMVESLRALVTRLRHNEEELNCVQDEMETLRHTSAREKTTLASQLAQTEEELRHLRERNELLERRVQTETELCPDEKIQRFVSERNLLEQRLEEAHLHLTEIKTSWSEKITSLETQVGRLSRQAAEEGAERRRALQERDDMSERIKLIEFELDKSKHELEVKDVKINRLIAEIDELSTELRDLRSESEEEVTFLKKQIVSSDSQFEI